MTGYSYFSKFAFVRLDLSSVTGSSYVSGSAFYGHRTLKEIHLPEAVTYIESDAFQSCSALETIDIPGKVTMNTNCFRSCGSLVDVTIPHAVRLYADVFHDCQKLRSLILPEATSSGWWIFTDAAFRLIVIPKVVNMDDHYLDAYGSNQTRIEMVINQSISYRLRDDGASYYSCSDHTTPMRSITVVDDDGYVVSSNKEGVTVGMHWTNINFDLEDSDEPETADE
jgi:hypothetical protein